MSAASRDTSGGVVSSGGGGEAGMGYPVSAPTLGDSGGDAAEI
eukprot:CAMPEP_0113692068 /NCGR_PEP_ID=MMETSP0038_2-20120614/18858_1 /TAXON_ID=2898 /ORGANISM="Cryptomonas paramecium" /LENGTH=42 /DNA_ID=CAMNT_0000613897 /DNA_START=909 /DNA_END=1037 /DNA_ORIENTATION=- /assembly_acc=CAM_ASM_000170